MTPARDEHLESSMEAQMFEQIMQASEAAAAYRLAPDPVSPVLIPAVWGCVPCDMSAMIASPVWRNCRRCGEPLTVLTAKPDLQKPELTSH